MISHLPYLNNVVFSYTGHNPIFARVPWKIINFTRVTTTDKEQLWWTLSSFLWGLFFTNPAKDKKKLTRIKGSRNTQHIINLPTSKFFYSWSTSFCKGPQYWIENYETIQRTWSTNLLGSYTNTLLPAQEEARTVSFWGLQPTWETSSLLCTYHPIMKKEKFISKIEEK